MSAERRFGFAVRPTSDWHVDAAPDTWCVVLPHQCDSWEIAGEGYGEGVPHAQAVAELERFISEAQEALAALRERREMGDE